MHDDYQPTTQPTADGVALRTGATVAEAAAVAEREEKWQARGRRAGNALLTAALDLLADGLPILPLRPREKVPLFGGVITGVVRSARMAVDRWKEVPDANLGLLTGASCGLVVVDLDGPKGLAWWADFQAQHGSIFTRAVTSGRQDGGLHLHFRVPDEHRTSRLRGGNGLLAPGVDVKADGGFVVVPPSVHESGRVYEWLDRSEAGLIPGAVLEFLLRSADTARPERNERVRDRRGDETQRPRHHCLDGADIDALVEHVATTPYGRKALRAICDDLAVCPEGGGPRGGRDTQAFWSYGRAGYLVGSGLLGAAEALDALAISMDGNGLGRSRAKLHRFWERVSEGIEHPLRSRMKDLVAADGVNTGGEHAEYSLSELSDTGLAQDELLTDKSDSDGSVVGRGLSTRSKQTPPTASPLAIRLWDEGTFCASMQRFALKVEAMTVKRGPIPCGRMDCHECQRRLLAAWAETAATWMKATDSGTLQALKVEPESWPTVHKRLARADAQYFKVPTPNGITVLLWCRKILPDSETLPNLEEFEDRLASVWWENRSRMSGTRVDTSRGWQPPRKEAAADDALHLGVLKANLATSVAGQFGITDEKPGATSDPLSDQQYRVLQLSFPNAKLPSDPNALRERSHEPGVSIPVRAATDGAWS